jgi:hypothetical protein
MRGGVKASRRARAVRFQAGNKGGMVELLREPYKFANTPRRS